MMAGRRSFPFWCPANLQGQTVKVVDEVVCQCDHADRAPPQIIKNKLDKLIQKARDLGKDETIEELRTRWEKYHADTKRRHCSRVGSVDHHRIARHPTETLKQQEDEPSRLEWLEAKGHQAVSWDCSVFAAQFF